MDDRAQTNELYADPDFTEVTVAHKNRRDNKSGFNNQTILTAVTLCVAVIAIIVGSVAISRTNESNNQQAEVNHQNNLAQTANAETASASTGASTLLSTVPFCTAEPANRQACLNVMCAAEKALADLYNPNKTTTDMIHAASDQAYRCTFKEDGLDTTTEGPGAHAMADAVITDGNGHLIGPDGNVMVGDSGDAVTSPLFDVNECLLVWKEKLCFSLIPVGETAKTQRARRAAGASKHDMITGGKYIPVVSITDGLITKGPDGKLRRAGGKRSAAIMGCLSGMGKGAGAGGAMGGAVGTIFPGLGTAIGGAAGGLIGGAVGCAAGGGWLGRR
jgi:hypothetical protein